MLVDPFCRALGGLAYALELMTVLVSVGIPPLPTWFRLVMAHTLIWWLP